MSTGIMSPQKKATVVSTSVAVILVIVKLAIGIASGSIAVLASAIDSLLDSVVSMFNFFAIKKSEENPDARFQYGKGKIQALAGVIEGTVITISGLYIMYESVKKMINGSTTELLGPSIVVMLFSIAVTYFLVRYLMRVADTTNSIVIKADALHYKTDLWSNGAVLVALALVYLTGLDIIDALFGLAIGMYIIYSAYEIIEEGVLMLLDQALEQEVVDNIEKIIDKHPKITGYHWLKTRTDGTTNFIEFHMVLHPEMLLLEAHNIANEVEDEIMVLEPEKRWVITPHFDPYDDEDINEAMLRGVKLVDLEK
ncbi:MAG: cation diffusion facilitator family transporter [Campylobacterota bacterium]|nr:cation diffusion facilitator family transporter [Campylobacterota bacterium]